MGREKITGRKPGPGPPRMQRLSKLQSEHEQQTGEDKMKTQSNGMDKELIASVLEAVAKRKAKAAQAPESNAKQPPPVQEQIEPRDPPAWTNKTGTVVTRIWANKTSLGDIDWRIDQRGFQTDGWTGPGRRTIKPDQVSDAIRGLYEAKVWVKKTERRLKWRRLWS